MCVYRTCVYVLGVWRDQPGVPSAVTQVPLGT